MSSVPNNIQENNQIFIRIFPNSSKLNDWNFVTFFLKKQLDHLHSFYLIS